jgi:biopolymer transport protein ExbD
MKVRQRSKPTDTIPTSSMADIAFLLIIFFMVTTSFAARKGIDFRLPKKDSPLQADEELVNLEAVLIEVDASGRIITDGRPMNLEDIQPYIMPKLALAPNKPVMIKVDPEATYEDMINVLDELKQANVANIVLPSREEIEAWGDMF